MANVCAKCKTWRKNQYWNVFPHNKHHFFKVMLGDFRNYLVNYTNPPLTKNENVDFNTSKHAFPNSIYELNVPTENSEEIQR